MQQVETIPQSLSLCSPGVIVCTVLCVFQVQGVLFFVCVCVCVTMCISCVYSRRRVCVWRTRGPPPETRRAVPACFAVKTASGWGWGPSPPAVLVALVTKPTSHTSDAEVSSHVHRPTLLDESVQLNSECCYASWDMVLKSVRITFPLILQSIVGIK